MFVKRGKVSLCATPEMSMFHLLNKMYVVWGSRLDGVRGRGEYKI